MTKSLPWPMAFMNYKITDPTKPDKRHIAEAFSGRATEAFSSAEVHIRSVCCVPGSGKKSSQLW